MGMGQEGTQRGPVKADQVRKRVYVLKTVNKKLRAAKYHINVISLYISFCAIKLKFSQWFQSFQLYSDLCLQQVHNRINIKVLFKRAHYADAWRLTGISTRRLAAARQLNTWYQKKTHIPHLVNNHSTCCDLQLQSDFLKTVEVRMVNKRKESSSESHSSSS